jgi:tRNA threonylcarbamoyladenosine biosynthesis protein TsaE
MTTTIDLPDPDATLRAGAAIAGELQGGMVVTVAGDLGAGKTTLARGVLRGLGWTGSVKSPTYGLVEHYSFSSLYFYHFDFYRFTDLADWENVGFAECFRDDSVCLIEWPERVAALLPPIDLALRLVPKDEGRQLLVHGNGKAGDRCERALTLAFRAG